MKPSEIRVECCRVGADSRPTKSKDSRLYRSSRILAHTFALAVLAGVIPPAWAQLAPVAPGAGSVHGMVVDRTGSVYEGARVALSYGGTAAVRETVSDANGQFSFADLPAGEFKLTVSSSGFQAESVTGTLQRGESYQAQPIELRMSSASSEVRVTATQDEIAQEQLHDAEKQRVLGIVPNFNVVYAHNPPPLNTRQKFELVWKMSIDPFTLVTTGLSAGIEQANNDLKGYGQGTAGYARRFGAGYGDNVIGTVLGGAILPSLFRQDPRYFYKGTGSKKSRVLYAIANSVMCKGDNGQWQPNYSRILAGPAAGGIADLYLPAGDRESATLIFENSAISKAMGAAQNILQEFFIRKLTPKAPRYAVAKP